MKNARVFGTCFACIALVVTSASIGMGQTTSHNAKSPEAVPNILVEGDVPSALQQCQQLYLEMKRAGWNRWKVPLKLQHFPDQKFAEDPGVRAENVICLAVPDSSSKAYKEIAFFLDIYARMNIRHISDFHATAQPEGFYIVCFKNGDIQQVPVEDVRLMPKEAHAQFRECFPGQAIYKKSLPQLEYVALAKKDRP